jgi:choline dehydrogenase
MANDPNFDRTSGSNAGANSEPNSGPNSGRLFEREFDYVIVGAGTAGCLLANRLSADPANRVLLLEAGGRDDYHWIHIPVGYLYCIGNPRTDWMYETEREAGLNGRSIRYPRGKVWGGCSSINGMIYMRGQAADYDGWAARGNAGWSWEDVLPDFTRHENFYRLDAGGSDPLHGHGGEWRVESQRLHWDILDAFRQAAAQVGIAALDDFNRGDNEGCGYFEVNQKTGIRWNASKAFLRPAQGRPNLTILSDADVDQVILGDQERFVTAGGSNSAPFAAPLAAQGVCFLKGGERWQVRAHREVILAAGAVGSPAILQRSGLGPQAVLDQAGVAVRRPMAGVGANLQDHLQLRLIYRLRDTAKTLNTLVGTPWGKAWIGLQYLFARRGPMTMAPSQLGAFARSSDAVDRADLEWHVQPLSLDRFGEPLHDFPAFTASVCHLRPESRGSISIASADPLVAPRIAPNYLSTEGDRRIAAQAIRRTRAIASAPALSSWVTSEHLPGAHRVSDEDLALAASEIGTTIFHPVGTCAMGVSTDPMAVVDARLRVYGVAGLRIADASVMPSITSGNTNAPTLMIAEKAAAMVLEDSRI